MGEPDERSQEMIMQQFVQGSKAGSPMSESPASADSPVAIFSQRRSADGGWSPNSVGSGDNRTGDNIGGCSQTSACNGGTHAGVFLRPPFSTIVEETDVLSSSICSQPNTPVHEASSFSTQRTVVPNTERSLASLGHSGVGERTSSF